MDFINYRPATAKLAAKTTISGDSSTRVADLVTSTPLATLINYVESVALSVINYHRHSYELVPSTSII